MSEGHDNHYNPVHVKEHFHIRRELTWGHLMTTAATLGLLVTAWMDLDGRVDRALIEARHNREMIVEQKAETKEMIVEQKAATKEMRQEIKGQFDTLNHKLDRLIERELNAYSNGRKP